MRVAPGQSPPLWLIAPFFLVAPAGMVAAGLLLLTSGPDVFVAINLPRTVAVTHALVIGWIATSVMGATYQLAPAVLGGPLFSIRLAALQFGLHLLAVPLFVWSLLEWNTLLMSIAGSTLAVSLLLFVVNAYVSLLRAKLSSLPRTYLLVSLAMLVATMSFGLAYVGSLERAWFPVSLHRLSAHAHLGLVGWLSLTVMGVSYQLVPMFNVAHHVSSRLGHLCLAWTAAATLAFAGIMLSGPTPGLRMLVTVALAAGPAAWGLDQARLMARRSRRKLDVQGTATLLALALLSLAIPVAVAASNGTPGTSDAEPARWLLAYAALGLVGWVGVTLIGNSYKILPFLVWFHRYSPLIGREPVPMLADMYDDRRAVVIARLLGLAALVLAGAALIGNLDILRLGGALLAGVGVAHAADLVRLLVVAPAPQVRGSTQRGGAAA